MREGRNDERREIKNNKQTRTELCEIRKSMDV